MLRHDVEKKTHSAKSRGTDYGHPTKYNIYREKEQNYYVSIQRLSLTKACSQRNANSVNPKK